MMPYEAGPYAGKRMSDIDPREILRLYYTDHFTGNPRQWVVTNFKRLKYEAGWTDEDTKIVTRSIL